MARAKAEKKYDLYEPMPNPQWQTVRLPDGTPSVPIERMEEVIKAVIAERLAKGEARRKRDAKR